MRAIIPVAGFGTRMRPHTFTVPKVLMNVAGKPMLDYIIDDLVDAGVDGVTLIVGFLGDVIEKHIREVYSNLDLNFVEQKEMLGLGHAISLGRDIHKDDDELLIILGDTILQADFKALLSTSNTALGVREVDDPRRFGVVELDGDGYITAMVEKPEVPPTNKAIVGVYKINDPALLFEGLDHIVENDIRSAKEIQLTDALVYMLEKGHKMETFDVRGWLDCGKPETLADTNQILLDRIPESVQKEYKKKYPDALIISPVSIAEGVKITGSVVGPYTVLGKGTQVTSSIIKDSIVGDNTKIENEILEGSLIGSDVSVKGITKNLNIGDTCQIKEND